jgi:hypothetical protein
MRLDILSKDTGEKACQAIDILFRCQLSLHHTHALIENGARSRLFRVSRAHSCIVQALRRVLVNQFPASPDDI